LVDELVKLDTVRDTRTRHLYEDLLPSPISSVLVESRSVPPRQYALDLVQECQRHAGGLRALIDALRSMHPKTVQLSTVEELLRPWVPQPLFKPEERARLHQLIDDVPSPPNLLWLYHVTVGPVGPPIDGDISSLIEVVDHLEEVAVRPDAVPPLLVFVENLAWFAESVGATEVSTGLLRWNEDTAARMGLPTSLLVGLRDRVRWRVPGRSGPPALLVQIGEDGVDPDRYQLSAWLWSDGSISETLAGDDHAYALEDIEDELDRLLVSPSLQKLPVASELMVEFILPHRLLSHPVDQWLVRWGTRVPHRLGVDCPVVVRSLERLLAQETLATYGKWRRKWRWLQENGHDLPQGAVRWVRDLDMLSTSTAFYEELAGDSPVCVVWSFPPAGEEDTEILGAGIWAGTPVMLWPRSRHDEGVVEAQFAQLLATGSLSRLPEMTWKLRAGAAGSDDHFGRHLTLLWDDPERLPEPHAPLSAPTRLGDPR
jgi:hypothetical protein